MQIFLVNQLLQLLIV